MFRLLRRRREWTRVLRRSDPEMRRLRLAGHGVCFALSEDGVQHGGFLARSLNRLNPRKSLICFLGLETLQTSTDHVRSKRKLAQRETYAFKTLPGFDTKRRRYFHAERPARSAN